MINKDERAEVASTGATGVGGGSTHVSDVVRKLCAAARPAALAGSLLAAPPGERAAYGEALAGAGAWVHLDLIDDAYPLGGGVSADLVAELSELRARLDVHLLVTDPAADLASVLAHRPARVTIQVENLPTPRGPHLAAAARSCREAGTDLWVGIAPATSLDVVDEVRTSIDGVLVMLAEPGRAGTVADPALVSRAAVLQDLPCGVDGGVTEHAFADLNDAGVNHIVMGRRLWALVSASETPPDDESRTRTAPEPATSRGRGTN